MKSALKFSIIPVLLLACYIGISIRTNTLMMNVPTTHIKDTQAEVSYTYMYSELAFDGEICTVGTDTYKAVVMCDVGPFTLTVDKPTFDSLHKGDTVDISLYSTPDGNLSAKLN